jgi:hypothetical protein
MGVIFSATQANKPPPVEGLEKDRVQIAGAFVLCPMVESKTDVFPSRR